MSFAVKALKFISGCLGTIFIFIAIFLLITSLVGLSLLSNLGYIKGEIRTETLKFVAENKEEIKQLLISDITAGNKLTGNLAIDTNGADKVNKTQAVEACQKRDELIKQNQEAALFLTPEFCNNIEMKTEEEIKSSLFDVMLNSYVDKMLNEELLNLDFEREIHSDLDPIINQYKAPLIFSIILILILGIFFTFAAAGFNFVKGLYKNCLKLGIILLLGSIPFIIIYLLTPGTLASIATQYMTGMNLPPQMAVLFSQLVAQIALSWIHSALLPLFIFVLISGIIFIILAIILKKRVKLMIKK